MKVLITGVGGFCGPHLVSRLRREAGNEIAGLGRRAGAPPNVTLDQYFKADITDSAAVDHAVRTFRPDWVFHLAGLSGNAGPTESLYDANISGTIHLLESVRTHVARAKILLVGSFAEYGAVDLNALPVTESTICRPCGAYGISKYAATLIGMDYARQFGLDVVVVRPSNIVGAGVPASLVVGAMLSRAKRALASSQPTLEVGDCQSRRDFIAVSDVVDAYVVVMRGNIRMGILNICSGQAHSIRSVAEMLAANSPVPIRLNFDPNLVPESFVRCLYGSYEKAARTIGFKPVTSLAEALRAAWRSEIGASS